MTSHRPEWWADTMLTVDPDDYMAAVIGAGEGVWDAFDSWLEEVTGRPLGDEPLIITATLGEGVLRTQEADDPWHSGPPDFAHLWTEREYPAPTPPPVWPARVGRDTRHEGAAATCPRCAAVADVVGEWRKRPAPPADPVAPPVPHDPQDESTSR